MDSFRDLYEEIIRGDEDLANNLRRAKILTNTLQSPPGFDDWIDSELNGYSDPEKVPDYRRFPPDSFGNFHSQLRGLVNDLLILKDNLPTQVKEFADILIIEEGVDALQSRGEGEERRSWPTDMVVGAEEATKLSDDLVLHDAYQQIPVSVYSDILNQVKNTLLDFLLKTESVSGTPEKSDTPEATEDPSVSPDAAGGSVSYHIQGDLINYGDRNTIATGEQVSQQVTTTIVKGDVASLLQQMREYGIEEKDILELQDAVSSEPEALPDGSFGAKVAAWLDKASTGVLKVGLETASEVLPKVLKAFYGM